MCISMLKRLLQCFESQLESLPSWVWPPAGFGSCQAKARRPEEVMMAGLLSGCSSQAPCTDTFRSTVWIPLSDSLHHRSCHHCNQKPDMSTLVMDGPHSLHRRHHKLTHVHPGMKTRHLRALRELGVSSQGSCIVSRRGWANCHRFLARVANILTKPPDRRDLMSSAPKLHITTQAGSQGFCLIGCCWGSTAKQTWTI